MKKKQHRNREEMRCFETAVCKSFSRLILNLFWKNNRDYDPKQNVKMLRLFKVGIHAILILFYF